jgi:hypothetical protein
MKPQILEAGLKAIGRAIRGFLAGQAAAREASTSRLGLRL